MRRIGLAVDFPYVPELLPDELLYSWLGRLALLNTLGRAREAMAAFFNNDYAIPTVDLPAGLTALQRRLDSSSPFVGEVDMINRATLYPYHRPFISKERDMRIQAMMLGGGGKCIKTLLGRVANRFGAAPSLRYCVACLQEQVQEHGKPYWRREQQLPGVTCCSRHRICLFEAYVSPTSHKQEIIYPPAIAPFKAVVRAAAPVQLLFARLSAELLTSGVNATDSLVRQAVYMTAISKLGLLGVRKSVNFVALSDAVRQEFNEFSDFPHQTRLLSPERQPLGWIRDAIQRPERAVHPICHLILIQFLFNGITGYITALSKVCNSIIRTPPGDKPTSSCKSISPKLFALSDLLHDGSLSCREVARRLRFSTQTIVNQRRMLGLHVDTRRKSVETEKADCIKQEICRGRAVRDVAHSFNVSLSTVYRLRSSVLAVLERGRALCIDEQRVRYRKHWESCLRPYATQRVTNARRDVPAVYAWLYRNDRDWLSRTNIKAKAISTRNLRVDWRARDQTMCLALATFIESHQKTSTGPRLSKSLMCRHLGEAVIRRNLHKLPKLRAMLQECNESVEQYQLRRINVALEQLTAEGIPPALWRVCRRAGIRRPTRKIRAHVNEFFWMQSH